MAGRPALLDAPPDGFETPDFEAAFRPPQVKPPDAHDGPPDGFEDAPPDGFDVSGAPPGVAAVLPPAAPPVSPPAPAELPNAPAARAPLPVLPEAKIYGQGLDAYTQGDTTTAARLWARVQPGELGYDQAQAGLQHLHEQSQAGKGYVAHANGSGPLYAAALDALVRGDTTHAKDQARRALLADPGNLEAQHLLDRLQTPQPSATSKSLSTGGASRSFEEIQPTVAQEALNHVKRGFQKVAQGANRTMGSLENMLLHGVVSAPEYAFDTAVPGTPRGLGKDAALAALGELHAAYSSITGQDIPLSPETLQAFEDRRVSPDAANMAGQIVGGMALLSGVGSVLGSAGLAGTLEESLYKAPALLRYILPRAAAGAVDFGGAAGLREGIRQAENGQWSLADLGRHVLKDTALGAATGAVWGIPEPVAAVTGAGVLKAGVILAQGGSPMEALTQGTIDSLFTALSLPGLTEAQRVGAYRAARRNMHEAARAEAERLGHTPESATRVADAAVSMFEQGVAKMPEVNRQNLDKFSSEVYKRVQGIIKPPAGTERPAAAPETVAPRLLPPPALRVAGSEVAPEPPPSGTPPVPAPGAISPAPAPEPTRSAANPRPVFLPGPGRETLPPAGLPVGALAGPLAASPPLAAPETPSPLAAPVQIPRTTRVPGSEVEGLARALYNDALAQREDQVTPLERFIIENGGIARYKRDPATGKIHEAEEYQGVAVRLRGTTPPDVMEQEAKDAGVIPQNRDFWSAVAEIGRLKRGSLPRLQEFIEPARAQLQHEYEVYGRPQKMAFPRAEAAPFEKSPGYSSGQPHAAFIGWEDRRPFEEPTPRYNIQGEHPKSGSTVSAKTLEEFGIAIPPTPSFEEWKAAGSPQDAQEGGASLAGDRQPDLFGGGESRGGRPERIPEGQGTLFGAQARPRFEFKKDAASLSPEAERIARTEEAKHQLPLEAETLPRPLTESVVVKDLVTQGSLPVRGMTLSGPEDVAAIFHFLTDHTVESLYLVATDAQDRILGMEMLSMGTLNSSLFHPRDAFKGASLMGAKKVYLVHNHPSGDPSPSREDMELTRRAAVAAKDLGMELKGHIVIDDTKFSSIRNKEGIWNSTQESFPKAGTRETTSAPVVKPMAAGKAGGEIIQTPADAAAYLKKFSESKKAVMALALDTRGRPASVWVLGEDFPSKKETVKALAKIALRNNANTIILSSARIPSESWIKDTGHDLLEHWGVEIVDAVSGEKGLWSAHEKGLLRDASTPYGGGDLFPGGDLEARAQLNRKRGEIETLRIRLGLSDADFLKAKIEATRKGIMAEMDNRELDLLKQYLAGMQKAAAAKAPDVEAWQKRLAMTPFQLKALRKELFGKDEGRLSPAERETLVKRMRSYPLDVRGHAVVWDIPDGQGNKLDKKFAHEVGAYRNIPKGMEMVTLESWRMPDRIDPTGHLKTLTFDAVDQAIREEFDVIASIRDRLAAVRGEIKMDSPESERVMRWGEKAFGPEYLAKVEDQITQMEEARKTAKSGARWAISKILRLLKQEQARASKFDPATVTDQEKRLDAYLRRLFEDLHQWENAERRKAGKEEIPHRRDYYTHMWERNILDAIFGETEDAGVLSFSEFTKPNAPFNPYELRRRGLLGYKMDALGSFDRYIRVAVKESLYRPIVQRIRRMIPHLPGRSGNVMTAWLNDLAGKTSSIDRAIPVNESLMRIASWLNHRAKQSYLLGNLNFIVTNSFNAFTTPGTLSRPIGMVGPVDAARGYLLYGTSPSWRSFAHLHSSVLQGRQEIGEMDTSRMGALQKFLVAQTVENFNVGGAFLAGYLRAIDKGLSKSAAVVAGDTIARASQADYRKHAKSPWMRSKLGSEFLGTLQTYSFNMFNRIVYDHLDGMGVPRSQRLMGLLLVILSMGAANIIRKRAQGRKAFDTSSALPYIPVISDYFEGTGAARPNKTPVIRVSRDLGQVTKFLWKSATGDEKRKDAEAAQKALQDIAWVVIPVGTQIQRFVAGRVFPKPEKKPGKVVAQ